MLTRTSDRPLRVAAAVRHISATIGSDVRYALRTLRLAPAFAAAAILCLALGTGATAAVFAVVNALLFRPLAVERPGNLVVIGTLSSGGGLPGDNSYQNYLDIRNLHAALDGAAAWLDGPVSVRLGDRTDLRLAELVSENYWSMLGVRPVLGRAFTAQEALERPPLAVISYRYWKQAFDGASDVPGRVITIDGMPVTIVGVAPRTFVGAASMVEPDAWIPATMLGQLDPSLVDILQRRAGGGFKVIGRLGEGVSLSAARSALGVLAIQLQHQYPIENEGKRFVIERELRARPDLAVTAFVPSIAGVFMALTTLVLLIACANVASLMLARANGRRAELAVRTALGARRARLARQLLTESIVIAMTGGGIGILLALGVARWLSAMRFAGLPIVIDVSLDWRVLAITAVAVLLASIMSGVGPALRTSEPRLNDVLNGEGRSTGSGASQQRFRVGLVTGQIAVSFVLLVAAGLFLRSMQRARTLDLGFRQDHEFMATVDVSLARYDSAQGKRLFRTLLARAAQLPGVRAAALASTVPLGTSHTDIDVYADLPTLIQERGHTHVEIIAVTPGYFGVTGTRLLRGRDFTRGDDSAAPRVMVVNAATARRLWPGRDPVGERVRLDPAGPDVEVIGVVQTVTSHLLGERPNAALYVPFAQRYYSIMTLHLQTESDPQQFAAPAYAMVTTLDGNLTPYAVQTMTEHLDQGIAFTPIRLAATVASVIGLLGLTQALIGLYAVVAYSVAQRRREIGIRMAMGATSRDILRGVVREGMALAAAGLALGFVISLGVGGVLRSLLIDVGTHDPLTFGALGTLLAVVTLVACWIPASQAARLAPVTAIRGGA